jgi:histidinol-phosphate phosphatase family protein
MRAVIMAGGKGKRLQSVTRDEIPKPLAPVNGKPILQWQIECLHRNGINEICIVTGYLGEKIREALGDGSKLNVKLQYYNEETPLGTAGALAYLHEFVRGENFILAYGDCIFDIDIQRMFSFHKNKNACATLFAHPNSHPYDSDLLLINGDGKVNGILEKNIPRNGWYDNMVNAGFYILNADVCDEITKGKTVDLEKEILANLILQGKVYGYISSEYIKDAGTPERINEVADDLKKGVVSARNLSKKQKCIFIDRDGTINFDSGFIYKVDEFELLPSAASAIKAINKSGYLAIIITNQPVVARGLCDTQNVETMHKKMKTLLGAQGAYADAVYYCPHHPDKGYPEENAAYKIICECRKPKIGMVEQAMKDFNISAELSWFVGDTTTDIQTGKNAGLKTALVKTGAAGKDGKYNASPNISGEDLQDAISKIIGSV